MSEESRFGGGYANAGSEERGVYVDVVGRMGSCPSESNIVSVKGGV